MYKRAGEHGEFGDVDVKCGREDKKKEYVQNLVEGEIQKFSR